MIAGIGIDLVCIPRMEKILEKWGDRFKKRVFSASEIEYSESRKMSGRHFAGSFAVKEAFFKAIGSASEYSVRIGDIEVLRDKYGKPYIALHGETKLAAEQIEISSIHTSISHDGEYSAAVVVLEKS